MAKLPSSAIGIDIGRYSMKAVALQRRKNGRLALTHFAIRELVAEPKTVDAIAANLKALLHELGGKGKACGIALSHSDSFLRIIEQPEMSTENLRDALRYTSQTLLNQDCKDYVLDCDRIGQLSSGSSAEESGEGGVATQAMARYIVGGLPRMQVRMIYEASMRVKLAPTALQLSAIATLNAFEHSHDATFSRQAFVLADMGHESSTVFVGAKGELVVMRALDYGGRQFAKELGGNGASGPEALVKQLGGGDPAMLENARLSLTELLRSISSSIGFVEARHEELIPRVFLGGGLTKVPQVSALLTEELQLPCEVWNPFAKCDVEVSPARKPLLTEQMPMLAAAFGVAAEILGGR